MTISDSSPQPPVRARPVSRRCLRAKVLGDGAESLHATINKLMSQHIMDIHDCVDKWVTQEDINKDISCKSPWGSRAGSPMQGEKRRRNQEGNVIGDDFRRGKSLPSGVDTNGSFRTSDSSPASHHKREADETYVDEHFPGTSFPPVPGAIELKDHDLEPESTPRLLGLEGPVKEPAVENVAPGRGSMGFEAGLFKRLGTRPFGPESGGGLLGAPGQVFADVGAIKEQLKQNMKQAPRSVSDYYWETGWFRWIAKHAVFESCTLLVIMINAVWMGYDADQNDKTSLSEAEIQFIIAENAFCAYFFFEWIIRFGAFMFKSNCLFDAWFVFDSILLAMMIVDTWVLPSVAASGLQNALSNFRWLRLIRLTRLARLARLLRAVPQLLIMIKAIIISMKTVSYTFVLLILMVYIFGVAFTILTDGNDDQFDGVFISMNTLLLAGALPDQGDLVNRLRLESIAYYILIVVYLVIASLTLMNMLIGILTEVVSGVATLEKEEMQLRAVKERLWALLTGLNLCTEENDLITQEAFKNLVLSPQAAMILEEVDVDVVGLVESTDYIFSDEHPFLCFADFMEVILQLRGSNTASVKDIVDLRKLVIKHGNDLKALVRTLSSSHASAAGMNGRPQRLLDPSTLG